MFTKKLKEGMKIQGKTVDKVMEKLRVYYDTETHQPIGNKPTDGSPPGMMMFDPDQKMPVFTNQPQWWEEREIMVVIFKKK